MMTIAHAVGSPVSKCRARKNRDGKRVRERERERGGGGGRERDAIPGFPGQLSIS
jgi:hypothetical protein